MKKNYLILALGFLMACTPGKETFTSTTSTTTATTTSTATNMEPHIDAVRQQFAPDKRTALFQVKQQGEVLSGETNMTEAKEQLLDKLKAENITFVDSIAVLPEAELEGQHFGIIAISVANLRSEPRHPAELATQATMGTPVNVLKKKSGWYLVQTPDKYLAWVDASGVALMDENTFNSWQKSPKLLYTKPYGFAYASKNAADGTVSDLVYGDVLALKGKSGDQYEVRFPDGREGFVPAAEAVKYDEWIASRKPTSDNLVSSSKQLLGLPYLWGGTSFKGVDCSGFTKTIYFMNGLVLPRDASQQIHMGELVDTSNGWDKLQPGDLLFFGVPAKDGKAERVVHVGMWIGGDQEFIHSAGRVKISSMNAKAANFDDSELKRFLRAKRITPEDAVVDLRKTALYQ
ncbi:C40 family peptidase [Pontibacter akesuensis]|uniref:SH3 domain-containing protein n=1 Tax=Pontibacter akesuensis TaxID=388950 RepID=A0A1I7GP82_9BACT|nr:C40 family peptidase [Pontibacter akesuensis]GHA55715.1 cytochrome c [Pontibacter akesuensis]SFU50258.1 SH3 domain-containing protein [Pontibacter akesuensis]